MYSRIVLLSQKLYVRLYTTYCTEITCENVLHYIRFLDYIALLYCIFFLSKLRQKRLLAITKKNKQKNNSII